MREPKPGEVAVLGCGAFVPGFDGLAGWMRGEASAAHEAPAARIVPMRQRRRASPLSKALADAYADVLETAGLDPVRVASVFGSALGEASTMIGLLDQMWTEGETLSPMRFATSVHNAASGMVSIATANRGITTSLGADYDTPAMALLEGIAMVLSDDESVVVCCGDEAPPEGLIPTGAGWGLMTAAIAIGPLHRAPASSAILSDVLLAAGTLELAPVLSALSSNPNIGLLDLVRAIQQGKEGRVSLDRGAGRGFSVRLEAPEE